MLARRVVAAGLFCADHGLQALTAFGSRARPCAEPQATTTTQGGIEYVIGRRAAPTHATRSPGMWLGGRLAVQAHAKDLMAASSAT
jgi:hypothetical protein